MDLQMPEMDGLTASTLIRAEPHLQQLPIIAMTAHVMADEVQRCLEAGMNDHVGKPIDPEAFFATLGRWSRSHPRIAPSPQAKAPLAQDVSPLPDIEGVDIGSGLRRVAGNKRLYRDLLGQFVLKQKSACGQVTAALQSGDRSLAERLAHSLKGAAGNLGINQIFDLAGKLETATREPLDNLEGMVKELTSALDRQIQVIEAALRVPPALAEKRDTVESADPSEIAAAVARLTKLLETSDADARQAYAQLAEILRGRVDAWQLEALRTALDVFDFETALVKLREMLARGSVNQQ
jgi:CheY-like chemotaxis protein